MAKKITLLEERRRKAIIVLAAVVAIMLYMAGVFSGLMANKVVKMETEENIISLKQETKYDLDNLKSYVSFLESSMKSLQLEQIFVETLGSEEMCEFSTISLNELVKQLRYYWERLPFRIEAYEKQSRQTEEYSLLKQQYTQISLRTWITAKNMQEKCDSDLVNGLYFYSTDCELCIEQGEKLDLLKAELANQKRDVMIFTIDIESDEPIVKYLVDYYKINSTPAIIINEEVYQGRLFESKELI